MVRIVPMDFAIVAATHALTVATGPDVQITAIALMDIVTRITIYAQMARLGQAVPVIMIAPVLIVILEPICAMREWLKGTLALLDVE